MKKKAIILGLLIMGAIVLVVNCMPNEYEKTFVDNGKNEPYAQGVPLHEMDFEAYEDYFLNATTALGYNYTREIELPCDVNYYASKEDSKPVLTLKKGTTVYVMSSNGIVPIGYGFQCWPDYEKGWRYGYTFLKADFRFIPDGAEMYYVKSNELEKVVGAFYKANQKKLKNYYRESQYKKLVTQYIDESLYLGGAYLSEYLRDR